MTELFPDVMHVMSGNKPNGTWFIECTEVELGYSLMECISWLFPQYNQWVMERESENGPAVVIQLFVQFDSISHLCCCTRCTLLVKTLPTTQIQYSFCE